MRTQSKAFTLIELLVVIAIIAILAAILFPVFAQAREKARAISCVSNEKQVALAVLMYIQDYDETFPRHWYGIPHLPSDPPFSPQWPDTIVGWNEAVYPYVKNVQLFRCPDSPRSSGIPAGFGNDDTGATGAVGYSINARLAANTGFEDDGDATGRHPSTSDAALSFPAVTILISESSSNCSDGCSSSDENEWGWEGRHVDKLYGDGWDFGGPGPSATYVAGTGRQPLVRHNNGANYAFSDGHVKFLTAGSVGWQTNAQALSSAQIENSVAFALGFTNPGQPTDSNTGQRPTYCLDSNCQYNVPPNP